jgi:hypothetical protein
MLLDTLWQGNGCAPSAYCLRVPGISKLHGNSQNVRSRNRPGSGLVTLPVNNKRSVMRINVMRNVLVMAVLLCTSLAMAQSSGNFNAAGLSAACAIGNNGNLSGGITNVNFFETYIQTSNGQGVTLDIRPDLITGLYTDTKVSSTLPSSSAETGVQVCVTVDDNGSLVKGGAPDVSAAAGSAASTWNNCAIYDQRFQQISTGLFNTIAACAVQPVAGSSCTTNADCTQYANSAGPSTCSRPTGATSGVCVVSPVNCNFDLVLSTLSAHSYDFVASMPGQGNHKVRAEWTVVGTSGTNGGTTESCVGPGLVSVTQMKVFQQDGQLSF